MANRYENAEIGVKEGANTCRTSFVETKPAGGRVDRPPAGYQRIEDPGIDRWSYLPHVTGLSKYGVTSLAAAGPFAHWTDWIEPPPGMRYAMQLSYDAPFVNGFGAVLSSQRSNVPRNVTLSYCWPRSSIASKVMSGSSSPVGAVLVSALSFTVT